MRWSRFIGALVLCCASSVSAFPLRSNHVAAELVPQVAGIQPGQPFWVALRLQHDSGWHTYWRASSTGFPTSIEWTLPEGFTASDIYWPTPKVYQQAHIVDYVFEGETFLPVQITPPEDLRPGTQVSLKAAVEWLMCADVCIPGDANVSLQLPVVDAPPPLHPRWGAKVSETLAQLPRQLPEWQVFAARDGDAATIEARPVGKVDKDSVGQLYFYSSNMLFVAEPVQQQEELPEGGYRLHLTIAETAPDVIDRLNGVLAASEGWGSDKLPGILVDVPLASVEEDETLVDHVALAAAGEIGDQGGPPIMAVLAGAFLGGFILNLMPCVFPVLGIKIISFVNQAGQERSRVVLHGVVFTAGVLLSFWVLAGVLLALRLTGENVGWGFQLQEPAFVFFISVLLLLFGLNMSGVFEIGQRAVGVGGQLQTREGFTGSFFSGILATVVATPCSAPFLAGALGAALAMPPLQMLLVFTFVAIGLASPYLILSLFPHLAYRLPRPGPWMESLKQGLAFLLYASVAFLVWSISPLLNNAALYGDYGFLLLLFALIMAALAAWIYGRWVQPSRSRESRIGGGAVSVLVLIVALFVGYPKSGATNLSAGAIAKAQSTDLTIRPAVLAGDDKPYFNEWRPGLPEQLAEQGHLVYVDFTARWCATCQTNKLTVFSSNEVIDGFREKGVIALKADWTARDPAITAELAKYGKVAVPFNLVYSPGKDPIELPPVLTPGIVLQAISLP